MKKQLLYLFFVILTHSISQAQCGGTFLDNGETSDYLLNSNETVTICPENPGDMVTVTFETFDTEPQFDGLYVFNGANSTMPQMASVNGSGFVPGGLPGAFWGTEIPGPFTSTSADGCLTFVFRSDAYQTSSGWIANVTCGNVTCLPPSDLNVFDITSESATLSWTPQGDTSEWVIEVLPAIGGTAIVSDETTFTLTGLAADHAYTVTVRSVCENGTTSGASSPLSFHTLMPPTHPLAVNTTLYTSEELVNEVLIGNPCLQISNVTSVTGTNFGSTNGIGFFTNTNPDFPLASGIVLSTGNAANVPGPNINSLSDGAQIWPGDAELETIINAWAPVNSELQSRNATSLEFDFVALNEFMSFNFLFASEEYGMFQCTYADAFAFLLTDQETGITTNLAVVPGTQDPISVVTIRDSEHNTDCASVNEGYFEHFSIAPDYTTATNFNGLTAVMTASSALVPNRPYHIKLVIADRTDAAFDSAVFIEAGSFTLGPPQCTDKLELVAFVDSNANGTKDDGETAFTNGSFSIDKNNSGAPSTVYSPIGNYSLFDENPASSYDIAYSIQPEFAPYYACPASYDDLAIAVGSGAQTVAFPVTLTQPFNDVSVVIAAMTPPRPGLAYQNKIVYKNDGVAIASGQITFVKDALTTITEISQPGAVATTDGFTYAFNDLQPNETRSFVVTLSVPAPPAVNLDDILTNSVFASAPSGDINPGNNTFSMPQVVVNSYDPNMVIESHGEMIDINAFSANEYLYYTIYFQNTGTASAIQVLIEDSLDSKLDQNTVVMLSSSHNYSVERKQNLLKWTFDYIMLPGQLENDALSKGYVFFKVKVKPGFVAGDIIPNTAEIFFDSNLPITTNTFNTIFYDSLGEPDFDKSDLVLYPNPARSHFTVKVSGGSDALGSIAVYDVVGKLISRFDARQRPQADVDISAFAKGVYLVDITTQDGKRQVRKLVVE
ncbi:choice-of-anchor L domain-containing protein [Flavobacterium selenitireducens]|uniref:choice-of-anchor L domain-containing protein n=1 Tax=Flavobacterium selenitireducens TaxID=2722704 RepID=UPI00168ADEB3|nr:choice-of-anchor L domain-containing protein [Flavobacterium selenitireducens]MBD3583104.1 T9SS type A sorting domain-containing protein [Flavobacterium selenitireducens]